MKKLSSLILLVLLIMAIKGMYKMCLHKTMEQDYDPRSCRF